MSKPNSRLAIFTFYSLPTRAVLATLSEDDVTLATLSEDDDTLATLSEDDSGLVANYIRQTKF